MSDELDEEVFICSKCKAECKSIDGTWPRRLPDGEWSVETDNESDWPAVDFICYDCIDW